MDSTPIVEIEEIRKNVSGDQLQSFDNSFPFYLKALILAGPNISPKDDYFFLLIQFSKSTHQIEDFNP
jgi:hypothetical protein